MKNVKLLFGQSYFLRFDAKLWQAMQPYPPLGTLYAASYLRQQGYEVALFDAMLAHSPAEWAAALHQHRPDVAILYEDNFNYLSKMCLLAMRSAALEMIAQAKQQQLPVIVCGSDATDHAEIYLSAGADYVLVGEGEETLAELLSVLTGRETKPLNQILGLVYQENGQTIHTGRRPDMRHLDQLPFPAWDLVDVPRYRTIWQERHGYYAINMVTTRGCPYHCNWCAKPIWGQRYNSRSPENVAAELKWLKETVNPDYIWFADDIMGLRPGWWSRFAELVEQNQVKTPFKCLTRADLILRHEADIPALARAGCDVVWMGAESGSQKILDAMEKGTTVAQIYEATQKLQAHGVRVGFFLQFGYPGESWADIELTLKMVQETRPDDIGMSVSYPLPGTKFYERVKLELGHKQNWQDSADLEMLYNGPFSTAFYRHLHLILHKQFRNQKAWQAWRKVWQGVERPGWFHLRELIAAPYRWLTLPSGRAKLRQLAQAPHQPAVIHLPHMPLAQAAEPSPQDGS